MKSNTELTNEDNKDLLESKTSQNMFKDDTVCIVIVIVYRMRCVH